MAWPGMEHSGIGSESWRVSSILAAFADVLLAFLVLLSAMITFVTSHFVRVSGLYVPCSCWAYRQASSSRDKEIVSQRSSDSHNSAASGRWLFRNPLEVNHGDVLSSCSCEIEEKSNADCRDLCELVGARDSTGVLEALMEDSCEDGREAVDVESNSFEMRNGNTASRESELREALIAEREALTALYLELEEERNASATAANETMAMITRLQEEKAAVQMESRQYQRMIEEKARYDQDAMERLKELIGKREEEKLALVEEVGLYRQTLLSARMEDLGEGRGESIESDLVLPGGTCDSDKPVKEEFSYSPDEAWRAQGETVAAEGLESHLERLKKLENWMLSIMRRRSPEPSRNQVEETASSSRHRWNTPRYEVLEAQQEPVLGDEENSGKGFLVLQPSRRDVETILPDMEGKSIKMARNRETPGEDGGNTSSDASRWSSPSTSGVSHGVFLKGSRGLQASANRTMEERKFSVLEYVSKLEEQSHQLGRRRTSQVGKGRSAVELRAMTQGESGRSMHSETSRKMEAMISETTGDEPLRRQLSGEGERGDTNLLASPLVEEGDDTDSLGQAIDQRVRVAYEGESMGRLRAAGETGGEDGGDEASFMHDVYEVQHARYESPGAVKSEKWVSLGRDQLGKPSLLFVQEDDERKKSEPGAETVRIDQLSLLCDETEGSGTSKEWEGSCGSSGYRDLQIPCITMDGNSRMVVEDVIEHLTLRLKALEADRHLMKQTIDSLRRENGEMKILQEIVKELREFRTLEKKDLRLQESSSFQRPICFTHLCNIIQAQLSKLARLFMRGVDTDTCQGDEHVGLCCLLDTSPESQSGNCIGRVRKADIIPVVLSATQTEALPSQPTSMWLTDVRTRSGTALSGSDY